MFVTYALYSEKKVHLIKQKQHDNINYNFSNGLNFYFNVSYCKKKQTFAILGCKYSYRVSFGKSFFPIRKE